ncbi:peptidoglycan-binding protein [Candidatus Kaiserbacteria bacterium]|nr:peptidoglycan-binding protein [Candidatus Kaiserbacteria bacterium]
MCRKVVFVITAVSFALPLLASAASCPNLTRNLSFGSRGNDVAQLQQFLISQNLLESDSATGYFGRLTEAAVKKFQCTTMNICSGSANSNGYGAVGPRTRAKIAAVCSTTAYTSPPTQPPPGTIALPIGIVPPNSPLIPPACSPLQPQTQTVSCPTEQAGSITQTRTSSCPGLVGSDWQTTSNTCQMAGTQRSLDTAIEDLFKNFWTGPRDTGHITPTWGGIVGELLPDSRGATWPASTFLNVLYAKYLINPSETNSQPIRAEWNYLKSVFSDSEFTSCGAHSAMNFGSDDTGWNAAAFLKIYDVTQDTRALTLAKGAVQCGFIRWGDAQLGGGLWYNDDKNAKSLYQIGLTLDAFRIFQLTHDESYLTLAKQSYEWMQQKLSRTDNIYWTDYGWWTADHSASPAPLGIERPNDIHLAGSVSFLAGTMAMDVMHARMFRLTNDDIYKQRAINTARGIFNTFIDSNSGFLDDRDGWANGTFVREWIIEVYPLLPVDLQQKAAEMFIKTAQSVLANDRTADGYYGPDWNGPSDAVWSNGTKAQQIMTSATAIDFVAGPPLIDAHISIPNMPAPSAAWQRDQIRKTALASLKNALTAYAANHNGAFPTTNSAWYSSEQGDYGSYNNGDYVPGLAPTYISALPRDPLGGAGRYSQCTGWKSAFLYQSDGTSYKLLSHCAPETKWTLSDPQYDPARPIWAWMICSGANACSAW